MEVSGQLLGRFTPRETAAGTSWIGGWMSPRAGLNRITKRNFPSHRRESNSDHPNAQPLYRLGYRGSSCGGWGAEGREINRTFQFQNFTDRDHRNQDNTEISLRGTNTGNVTWIELTQHRSFRTPVLQYQ
jgi:hypothetical protein